ncbi:MAG TPA: threonine/serine dehydratase [Symbiobacteriaceae bacterium]|jgi:threonine dehydratase
MISIRDIEAARDRIAEIIVKTPLLTDPTGRALLIKGEHLQRTGSFKLRGAANRVSVAVQQGATHVVTASSGNHGQAVAYIAQRLGIRATVVVPEDAPAVKVDGIRRCGAAVELCGLTSPERMARAEAIVRELGAVLIAPYDDPLIMAGQGTIGLEILEQLPEVETVFVPIGGGGLISGVATALKERKPGIRVIGVEPELGSDTFQSFRKGEIVSIPGSRSIADGLRTSAPGHLTFPVIQKYVDDVTTVSEADIREAVKYLLFERKQLVEPSGAVTVAAALRYGRPTVAVVSGGNVDWAAMPSLLA